jgi:hypothetical protein
MLELAHIAGISKIRYVLTTPRPAGWSRSTDGRKPLSTQSSSSGEKT